MSIYGYKSPNFTKNLEPGDTGNEVSKLQNYLLSTGYLTQQQINTGPGIYGPQTKAAVTKLQKDNKLNTAGYPGYFGPRTHQLIDELQKGGAIITTEDKNKEIIKDSLGYELKAVAPTTILEPGATGNEVQKLQDFLVSQNYLTSEQVATGPGIYGPQTKAAVTKLQKDFNVDTAGYEGYFGPKTIEALDKTTLAVTVPAATVPTSVVPTETVPFEDDETMTPILPEITSPQVGEVPSADEIDYAETELDIPDQSNISGIEDYNIFLTSKLVTQKQALLDSYTTQLERLASDREASQKLFDSYNTKELTALGEVDKLTQPVREKLEANERERFQVEQHYFENQKLVNELEGLLTEGSDLIAQLKGVTGLASIRNPRVNQAIEGINARAGVISAVMNARNNQISVAENFIDRTINAINLDRTDRINYYNSLLGFYGDAKKTELGKIIKIDDKKEIYIASQIGMLEEEVASSQVSANYIKELMVNPDTASIIAGAGVTLVDPIETINSKMATFMKNKNFNEQINYLTEKGYTYVPVILDSIDKNSLAKFTLEGRIAYFKKPIGKVTTGVAGVTTLYTSKNIPGDIRAEIISDLTDPELAEQGELTLSLLLEAYPEINQETLTELYNQFYDYNALTTTDTKHDPWYDITGDPWYSFWN